MKDPIKNFVCNVVFNLTGPVSLSKASQKLQAEKDWAKIEESLNFIVKYVLEEVGQIKLSEDINICFFSSKNVKYKKFTKKTDVRLNFRFRDFLRYLNLVLFFF